MMTVELQEISHATILEAGDYAIYVGNSVRNVKEVLTYNVEELVLTEQLSEVCCPNDENLTILKPGKQKADGTFWKKNISLHRSQQ